VRRLVLLALVLFPFAEIALAQQPQRSRTIPKRTRKYYLDEPRTRLEEFQDRLETVVVKGFMVIGTVSGRNGLADVSAVELKDTSDATRATGISIQLSEGGPQASEIQSFIDYEEIDPLIRGLDVVARADDRITKMPSFSASYRTRDDFGIVVFKQTRAGIAVRLEGSGLNGSGGIERVTIFITLDELNRLRGIILEAKQRIDEMK
jgi:hypothetical protein